tara:strand:+ start:5678 stop:6673 length:996 start_codon:yes stop_codon:yes gene_type:complete
MKILHVEPDVYNEETRNLLETVGSIDYVYCKTQAELTKAVSKAPYKALFLRLGLHADSSILDLLPDLQWIITPTTGLDHIALDEAKSRRIKVISLAGEVEFLNTVWSTAEHTWALLLALIRKIPSNFREVINGNWKGELTKAFMSEELFGKTLGIIGYGRLGCMVADYGFAFGMKVLITDHDQSKLNNKSPDYLIVSLERLLSESDVVSIHLPLNKSTYKFISEDRINLMKHGSLLINTARGDLIDEVGLLTALEQGKLAGAGLDVLAGECMWDRRVPDNHPLIIYAKKHDNLILSPHVGGYGRQSIYATRRFITEKFIRLIQLDTTSTIK